MCPFSVALLLSVARIQRYEEQVRNVLYALCQYYLYASFCVDLSSFISVFEQVFDILKATIIKNFKDEQLLQGSDLMKTLIPDCPSVAKMILDTVRNRSGHETFQEKHQKSRTMILLHKIGKIFALSRKAQLPTMDTICDA